MPGSVASFSSAKTSSKKKKRRHTEREGVDPLPPSPPSAASDLDTKNSEEESGFRILSINDGKEAACTGAFPFADALRRANRVHARERAYEKQRSASLGAPVKMTAVDMCQRREQRRKRTVANAVLEKVLANLGVLSEVQIGDKLDFTPKGAFVIQKPTWLSTASRLLKGNDRWQTFDQVETLVGTAESMVDEGSINDPRVREALVNSVHGLRNLQQTYLTDVTFKTRMEVLLQRIEMRYEAMSDEEPDDTETTSAIVVPPIPE